MNFKVFNLVSRINDTRHVTWYETFARKCRLTNNVVVNNVGIVINVRANVKNY